MTTNQITHTSKVQKVKEWVRKLESLDRSKSIREKFFDFCEMAYCALTKLTAPTKERADELEAQPPEVIAVIKAILRGSGGIK